MEGVHYKKLKNPIIEYQATVIEFFSYSCPFCYRILPATESIERNLPKVFEYRRIPVHLGKKKYEVTAYAWFLLNHFGYDAEMHRYIFNVVHAPILNEVNFNSLSKLDDVRNFFSTMGFSGAVYETAFSAIEDSKEVERADEIARLFKVSGTPTIIVKGKYVVQSVGVGPDSSKQLEDIVRFLLPR